MTDKSPDVILREFEEHINTTLADAREKMEKELRTLERGLKRELNQLRKELLKDHPESTPPSSPLPASSLDALLDSFGDNGKDSSDEINTTPPKSSTKMKKLMSWRSHSGLNNNIKPRRASVTDLEEVQANDKESVASRIVAALMYQHIAEIQLRHSKSIPKKYKNGFHGHAVVSFMLEKIDVHSRIMAVKVAQKLLPNYIICTSENSQTFQDSEDVFYEFKYPIFMDPLRIKSEIKMSVNRLLKDNEEEDSHKIVVVPRIVTEREILNSIIEYSGTSKAKKFTQKRAILYHDRIELLKSTDSSAEEQETITLHSIKNIVVDESENDLMEIVRKASKGQLENITFRVAYLSGDGKYKLIFKVPGDVKSTILWALGMDGLRNQNIPLLSEENGCCIDKSVKMLLLRSIYKSGYKGGIVKSGDEDWQYNSEGSVHCIVGALRLNYTWTGEFLQPSVGSKAINMGTGKWDGVNLYWFAPAGPQNGIKNTLGEFYHSREPSSHYIYDEKDGEYISDDGRKEWKWSRHFLASKESEREWIVEGDIPQPVIMLLQLMRYYIQDKKEQEEVRVRETVDSPIRVTRRKSARVKKSSRINF